MHTALHGYLRSACADARIAVAADASITALLKTLKMEHPGVRGFGVHSAEMVKVLNSFGKIVNALNTLRNYASVARANENLQQEDEALLAVNAVRTLFNYLVKKLR
ncbi:abortive infection family protein [Stenotrophomonas maltophilia]|uniref:abortive infection family protein n=1 Tax=Stenotrophomonas maltophilia TaxID=40324 RepID=UPI001C9A15BB|nr:abortive infection family protein [Stenotrophomonas maltophilia]